MYGTVHHSLLSTTSSVVGVKLVLVSSRCTDKRKQTEKLKTPAATLLLDQCVSGCGFHQGQLKVYSKEYLNKIEGVEQKT